MENAPSQAESFTDFIVDNFIDEDSIFPPSLWTENSSYEPRTINGRNPSIMIIIANFIQVVLTVFSVIK